MDPHGRKPKRRSSPYVPPPLGYPPTSVPGYNGQPSSTVQSQACSPPMEKDASYQLVPALPPPLVPPPTHVFRPPPGKGNEAAHFRLPPTPNSVESSPAGRTIGNAVSSKDPSYSKDGFIVTLQDADLWNVFNKVGNEMIVTKPGRRLFPPLIVSVRGLKAKTNYNISLRITCVDKYHNKFLNMRWVAVGESEVSQDTTRQIYKHPNSPKPGFFWMKKPVSFIGCKITHSPRSNSGNILLHTMHKYVMELVLTPVEPPMPRHSVTIRLNVTQFVAVSAYQNTALTQLKIDNNPFAKGFRDRDLVPPTSYPIFSPSYSELIPPWDQSIPMPGKRRGLPSVHDLSQHLAASSSFPGPSNLSHIPTDYPVPRLSTADFISKPPTLGSPFSIGTRRLPRMEFNRPLPSVDFSRPLPPMEFNRPLPPMDFNRPLPPPNDFNRPPVLPSVDFSRPSPPVLPPMEFNRQPVLPPNDFNRPPPNYFNRPPVLTPNDFSRPPPLVLPPMDFNRQDAGLPPMNINRAMNINRQDAGLPPMRQDAGLPPMRQDAGLPPMNINRQDAGLPPMNINRHDAGLPPMNFNGPLLPYPRPPPLSRPDEEEERDPNYME